MSEITLSRPNSSRMAGSELSSMNLIYSNEVDCFQNTLVRYCAWSLNGTTHAILSKAKSVNFFPAAGLQG